MRALLITTLILVLTGCIHVPTPEEQYEHVLKTTGLARVEIAGDKDAYLGKTHRGYPVLFRIHMGNVWGRYAARLAMGEIGTHLGGIWGFLTGGYRHLGSRPVGSPLDRLLSHVIGQPLSFVAVLSHGNASAPRLDVLSDYSTIKPHDLPPKRSYVSFGTGSIYSSDAGLADALQADQRLIAALQNFRSQYIRLDEHAATFFFAGSENEYSAMIRNHGSYEAFLTSIMNTLADIADKAK